MKKTILYFSILLCLFSCGMKSKDDLQRRREQARHENESREKEKTDIAEKAKSDSLAAIAWGDAIWGMTRDEVMRSKAFHSGADYDYTIEMNDSRKQKTKDYFGLKQINSIRAYIKDNSLQAIFLESWWVKTDGYDALIEECQTIIRNLNRIYGQPFELNDISFSGFNSEGVQVVANYNVGHRILKSIVITLHKRGYEYWYKVHIYPISIINRENETIKKSIRNSESLTDDISVLSF